MKHSLQDPTYTEKVRSTHGVQGHLVHHHSYLDTSQIPFKKEGETKTKIEILGGIFFFTLLRRNTLVKRDNLVERQHHLQAAIKN